MSNLNIKIFQPAKLHLGSSITKNEYYLGGDFMNLPPTKQLESINKGWLYSVTQEQFNQLDKSVQNTIQKSSKVTVT